MESSMTTKTSSAFAITGLCAALALGAGSAHAACAAGPYFAKLAAQPHAAGAAARVVPLAQDDPAGDTTTDAGLKPFSIAGLWKFDFKNTDGSEADHGFNAFHVEGTETMESFGRPPETGDVCMGMWKQVGPHHVKVNHYAPLYADDLVTWLGTVNFHEDLTLSDDGSSYSGPVSVVGYDPQGNVLFTGDLLASATRIRLNSPGW
jgi:hypothetical protein